MKIIAVSDDGWTELRQAEDGKLHLAIDRPGVAGVSSVVTSDQLYELAEKAEKAETDFAAAEGARTINPGP